MTIIRAAVGNTIKDFEDHTPLVEVWEFVRDALAEADEERPIVLVDSEGGTFGQIWDLGLFHALWETPLKMANHLFMAGFDRDDD